MAASGPWITLGRGPDHCRTACQRPAAPTSRHVLLCVSSLDARAQAFYTRHGYRQVGQFDDSVIDGASELLLYKRAPVV
jgi:ribosomal protein S18 acetylase RimI-like enzyme